MKTQAHIDETTGEQLAIVYRNHSGECQVRLTPWVLELLRACARKDDTPPAITRHVFYAHHFRDDGSTEMSSGVHFGSEAQWRRGARDLAPTHRGRHAVPRRAVDAPHPGRGRRPPPSTPALPGSATMKRPTRARQEAVAASILMGVTIVIIKVT